MNYFTTIDSPIGRLLLTSNGEALTGLYMDVPARDAERHVERAVAEGREDPAAAPLPEAARQLQEYFAGSRRASTCRSRCAARRFSSTSGRP